ncbi:MAG: AAA family ATPase [Candidatus Altiarchaeota archaeon]|nr:AAA family ATPase [Candidatus Altiarchaeota archaeon]
MDDNELVKTGIPGLDEILGGGFIPKTSFLVTGGPGTGKSILGLQFIIEGARKFNEPGVYITVEESVEEIRFYAKRLGWKIEDLEEKGLVTIIEQPVMEQSMVRSLVSIDYVEKVIKQRNAKRIVLDSLTLFNYMYGDQKTTLRTEILRFIKNMRSLGVTSLVISERYTMGVDETTFMHEDFIFQGIILLLKLRMQASYERCMNVVKLRGVGHSIKIYPFKIGNEGISVLTDATPFSLSGGKEGHRD